MTTALLAISDGRHDYHARSFASALEWLPKFDQYVFVDDPEHDLGFAGAIQHGWEQIETDYVMHWEADFVVARKIPVRDMVAVLRANSYLAQIALLRQPVNDLERAAGGVVRMHPNDYHLNGAGTLSWLEHRRHITTNPCVYPRWLVDRGWPDGPQSEGHFGLSLFAGDPMMRAAYWGAGEEWCEHIGDTRVGTGY